MHASIVIVMIMAVTFPMLLSLAGYGWSSYFGDPDRFPGSPRLHCLLIILQLLAVTMVYAYPSSLSLYLLAIIYAGQGIGVVYYIWKKGKVDCGCMGPQIQSKLGFPLFFLNMLMAALCLVWNLLHGFAVEKAFVPLGLLLEGMLFLLSLVIIVGVPDAIHAIRMYRELAAPLVPKVVKARRAR